MAFSRTKMCPARDASDWDADVVKVGRTVLTDTVKRRDCYFKLYLLWHCEPMKHVAKNRRDVFVRYVQLANRVFIHKVENGLDSRI